MRIKWDRFRSFFCHCHASDSNGGVIENNKTEKSDKEVQIILESLKLSWQDRWDMRKQTWNTVIASGALIVGLLTMSDKMADRALFMIIGCFIVFVLSIVGVLLAFHHLHCEEEKMDHIRGLEELLTINMKKNRENKQENNEKTEQVNLLEFYKTAEHSRIDKSHFKTSYFIMVYHLMVILSCLIIFFQYLLQYLRVPVYIIVRQV